MDIKTREEALNSPTTPKYKLKAFEYRMAKLRIYDLSDFIKFLYSERCEGVYDPLKGLDEMIKEYNQTGQFPWSRMQNIGEPLGCDFQFKKDARRKEILLGGEPYFLPQRFHCRVYLEENELTVVSETEINPNSPSTGVLHYLEGKNQLRDNPKPEHRIIHIPFRKRTWIQQIFHCREVRKLI